MTAIIEAPRGQTVESTARGTRPTSPKEGRLVSLDAYRGLIMLTLAGAGFGLAKVAKDRPDDPWWQWLGFHFSHSDWISQFPVNFGLFQLPIGVPYWDLIQPAFMFMVGVSLPYSYARRRSEGEPFRRSFLHAAVRALVLVLLGVFLSSQRTSETNWLFTNVLSQIGLGYVFVFLLMGRGVTVQLTACAVILLATWGLFVAYPVPTTNDPLAQFGVDPTWLERLPGLWAHWIKGTNAGMAFDRWFLNLFPRPEPFTHHPGGYPTLNFVPSIVTMIFGLICGELLRSSTPARRKVLRMFVGGAVCLVLGVVAGQTVCPIIKKLWTPSWTLFSGGYVIWMLAAFYLVVDVLGFRKWTFPLVVLGVNSLLIYLLGETLRPWTAATLEKHFGNEIFEGTYGPVLQAVSVLFVFWLLLYWLYRQRIFLRV